MKMKIARWIFPEIFEKVEELTKEVEELRTNFNFTKACYTRWHQKYFSLYDKMVKLGTFDLDDQQDVEVKMHNDLKEEIECQNAYIKVLESRW